MPTSECAAVEAIVSAETLGGRDVPAFTMRIFVSTDDLVRLAKDSHFFLTIIGVPALPPFSLWFPEEVPDAPAKA